MTSDYTGPVFRKEQDPSQNKKRRFETGLDSRHLWSDSLEEPAYKKQVNQRKQQAPAGSTSQSLGAGQAFEGSKWRDSQGSTPFSQKDRFAKASQAMQSQVASQPEQEESDVKEVADDYEIPFLKNQQASHSSVVDRWSERLNQQISLENSDHKDYNTSLSDRKGLTPKGSTYQVAYDKKPEDLESFELEQTNSPHEILGQDNENSAWISRDLLKRLIKVKESFLLFDKEEPF